MELEQLKDMWKEQQPTKLPGNVQPLLGKKSNTPIAKMKRNLVIELIAVIILYGLVILYFFKANQGQFASVSVLYLVMALSFCIYYYKKFKLLKEMECMACQVKSNLSKQVRTLEKYIQFYLIAGTAMVPVVMTFFFWFEITYIPSDKPHLFLLPAGSVSFFESISIFALLTLITTVVLYYINKWYVRKLYGNYVGKLREMLSQMDDDQAYS